MLGNLFNILVDSFNVDTFKNFTNTEIMNIEVTTFQNSNK